MVFLLFNEELYKFRWFEEEIVDNSWLLLGMILFVIWLGMKGYESRLIYIIEMELRIFFSNYL